MAAPSGQRLIPDRENLTKKEAEGEVFVVTSQKAGGWSHRERQNGLRNVLGVMGSKRGETLLSTAPKEAGWCILLVPGGQIQVR